MSNPAIQDKASNSQALEKATNGPSNILLAQARDDRPSRTDPDRTSISAEKRRNINTNRNIPQIRNVLEQIRDAVESRHGTGRGTELINILIQPQGFRIQNYFTPLDGASSFDGMDGLSNGNDRLIQLEPGPSNQNIIQVIPDGTINGDQGGLSIIFFGGDRFRATYRRSIRYQFKWVEEVIPGTGDGEPRTRNVLKLEISIGEDQVTLFSVLIYQDANSRANQELYFEGVELTRGRAQYMNKNYPVIWGTYTNNAIWDGRTAGWDGPQIIHDLFNYFGGRYVNWRGPIGPGSRYENFGRRIFANGLTSANSHGTQPLRTAQEFGRRGNIVERILMNPARGADSHIWLPFIGIKQDPPNPATPVHYFAVPFPRRRGLLNENVNPEINRIFRIGR